MVLHAAIGGSNKALLHLPAFAMEAGLPFDYDLVQRVNDVVPLIANMRPTGEHTPDRLWYAGGVPRLMWELRDFLHLDALTVTGRTIGENLAAVQKDGWVD